MTKNLTKMESVQADTGGDRARGILFVNQHYWPDVAATGQHLTDLAEYLQSQGYDVEVITSTSRYEGGGLEVPLEEVHEGVTISRFRSPGFGRDGTLGRLTDYAVFFLRAFLRILRAPHKDLLVLLTTPPLLPVLGLMTSVLKGQPYAIWSMDLHPDAGEELGILSPGAWYVRLLHGLNNLAHRRAEFVVDLGRYMKKRLQEKGIDPDRLVTIPVWSPGDEVHPVPAEENPLIDQLGLKDRHVIMYSGNAGLGHRFEEVLEAMEQLAGHPEVFFLFVGSGPRRDEIERFVRTRDIGNFGYSDYFPRDQLKYSLSLADLHLLTLKPSMAGIAVPAKLYGIMAVGKPVLMVGPSESEPAMVIREHRIGHVVDPNRTGDAATEVREVILRSLRSEQELREMGGRAREVFRERYSAEVVLSRWEEELAGELPRLEVDASSAQR